LIHPFKLEHDDDFWRAANDSEFALPGEGLQI
jgi:hypothetical protein